VSHVPALGPRGEGWVALQGVLFVIIAAAGIRGGPVLDGTARTIAGAVGLALIGAGGFLALRGVVDLREALTALPHPRDGAQLVESGSYGLVRHPIYGGLVVAAAGWAMVTASPPALLASVLLMGFFRLKSSREEAWLRERYPGYGAYAARTRRMLPGLY
jgi:protein-S-isoprenylcysteine O-methyltransferase Ste14